MALQVTGNRIVLEGVGKYLADSQKVNTAIRSTNELLRNQTVTAQKSKTKSVAQQNTELKQTNAQLLAINKAIQNIGARLQALPIAKLFQDGLDKLKQVSVIAEQAAQVIQLVFSRQGQVIAKSLALALRLGLGPSVIGPLLDNFQKKFVGYIRKNFGNGAADLANNFINVVQPAIERGLVNGLQKALAIYERLNAAFNQSAGLKGFVKTLAGGNQEQAKGAEKYANQLQRVNSALSTQVQIMQALQSSGLKAPPAAEKFINTINRIRQAIDFVQQAAKIIEKAMGPVGAAVAKGIGLAIRLGLADNIIGKIIDRFQKKFVELIRQNFGDRAADLANTFIDNIQPAIEKGLVEVLKLLLRFYGQLRDVFKGDKDLRNWIKAIAISDKDIQPLLKLASSLNYVGISLNAIEIAAAKVGQRFGFLSAKTNELQKEIDTLLGRRTLFNRVIDAVLSPFRFAFGLLNKALIQPVIGTAGFIADTFGKFLKKGLQLALIRYIGRNLLARGGNGLVDSLLKTILPNSPETQASIKGALSAFFDPKSFEKNIFAAFKTLQTGMSRDKLSSFFVKAVTGLDTGATDEDVNRATQNIFQRMVQGASKGRAAFEKETKERARSAKISDRLAATEQKLARQKEVNLKLSQKLVDVERRLMGMEQGLASNVQKAGQQFNIAAKSASNYASNLKQITNINIQQGQSKASGMFDGMVERAQGAMEKVRSMFGGGKDALQNATLSDAFKTGFNNIPKALEVGFKGAKTAAKGLIETFKALPPVAQGAIVALASVGVALVALKVGMMAFKAFMALGKRGAAFEGIIASFDTLARQAQQVPEALLVNMRKAANGTIADLDLITNANLALAGATGETAKLVGEGLPKLLEIARAQARSTGKDVNFLFNSLVEGVKKVQPELIDNTGLLVRVGEANEELAKKLGKSVEALSAQERQQAILNATLKAGEASVKQLANAELTAAEIQQQIDTNRKNALDTLALAVQPLYKVFLSIQKGITDIVLSVVRTVAPFISIIGQIIGTIITNTMKLYGVVAGLLMRFSTFGTIVKEAKYIGAIIYALMKLLYIGIKAYYEGLFTILGAIGDALDWVGDELIKIFPFLNVFREGLFIGAATAFGAFAAGVLQAANNYIFPAVITIAEFIADFLMGESPPPKGPLSTIDKGGANIMQAWLGGMAGVSLEPVTQVAQQVASMMGEVANYSLDQVKARLAELDAGLQPFADRLELVKARLEALTKPLETARDIIAKRLDKAVQTLTKGGGNAEEVRAIDKQLQLINERLALSQEELQTAQLQYDLVAATQAEERAALAIRERMLGTTEAIADAASDAATATSDAANTGGGGEAPIAGGGGLPALTGGASAGDSILGLDAIKGALGDLQNAAIGSFIDAGGQAQLDEARGNLSKLGTQTKRIGTGLSTIGDKITKPFENIGETLGGYFETAQTKFDEFFGEEGTITKVVNGIGSTFTGLFGEDGTIKKFFVGDESIFNTITSKFNEHFGPESPLAMLFGEGGLFGSGGAIESGFSALFGPEETEGTLLYKLGVFKKGIENTFASIFFNADSPLQRVYTAVVNVVEGIWGLFNAIVTAGSTLSISDALNSLKTVLLSSLVYPAVDAAEAVGNSVIDAINKAIANIWEDAPGALRSALSLAGLELGDFQITRLDLPYPTFHEGGVVRANLLKGEGVLSIPMMDTLNRLESYLRAPSFTQPILGTANNSTSIDRSQHYSVGELHYHEQPRLRRPLHEMRRMAVMGRF